jgi:WD40-like Beta Propeller Repeat
VGPTARGPVHPQLVMSQDGTSPHPDGMGRVRGSISARARALVVAVVAAAALAPVGSAPADAAYPGEDGQIAFVRAHQIHKMSAGGSSVTQLTSSGENYRPKWSPDGRRIAYIHETADGRHDVWVMFANGGGKRPVTTTGDVTSKGASWSPDGTTLAYAADGVLQLVSVTEGSTPTTPSGYQSNSWCEGDPMPTIPVDRFLAWSPTGDRIGLYNRFDCYYDYALWWFDPTTGEAYQYRALGADCCGYAKWSDLFFGPSGEFGYTESDGGDYGEKYGPRRIVYPGFASLAGDTGGAPSPSGRFMAFTNNASGTPSVMRADIDGTDRRRLTTGYQPDWQPRS